MVGEGDLCRPGTLRKAIHDLVDTKLRMSRGQDISHLDDRLKQAWQSIDDMTAHTVTNRLYVCIAGPLGRAGPHDLVLALAHLYVSKSSTGCLRPSARPEGSFAT